MPTQICAVIQGPTFDQALEQLEIASRQCSWVELRLDCFDKIDLEKIQFFRKRFSHPMIFTLRPPSQGGYYQGSENERLQKIKELVTIKPDYFDIEWTVPPSFIESLKGTKIILSTHDFEKMPPLEDRLQQMKKTEADLYKMAFKLQSHQEGLALLQFMKEHGKVVAMGMGPYGEATRILAPLYGAPFVYASLDPNQGIVPGQVSIEALSNIYRFNTLKPSTKIYGLIGNPVDKSVGHLAHNKVMDKLKIDALYLKLQVLPEQLDGFMSQIKKTNVGGLSVTIPLKELIPSYLDEIDPWAKRVGAVNTLVFKEGKIKGYNTDGKGALDAIEEKMQVKGKKVIIIGAGGASKAIIVEAVDRGAQVTILNRDSEKALNFAKKTGCRGGSLNQISEECQRGYDILINTTSVPNPIDTKWILPHTLFMDINTFHSNTPLIEEAKKKNCTIVYGIEMFIYQAIEQVRLWFGKTDQVKEIMTTLLINKS